MQRALDDGDVDGLHGEVAPNVARATFPAVDGEKDATSAD